MAGMEYMMGHLEDRKLSYHVDPDGLAGEDTNSQVKLARGRPDRNRQLPARFRDCETDSHTRRSRQQVPCWIEARDDVVMDRLPDQDHRELMT
jgi:hypothetical protein